jgi:hypothetical protein
MLILDLLRRYGEMSGIAGLGLMGPRRVLLNGSSGKGVFKYTYGWDLTQGSLPVGFSFSRASGTTQSDNDSCVNQLAANEACFPKLRYVKNLYANSSVLTTQGNTVGAGSYVVSFSGTGTVVLSGAATGTLVGQGANVRVAIAVTCTAGILTSTVTGSCTSGQLEYKSASLNPTIASEYVSTGVLAYPYHGTGVDGSQFFTTRLGNVTQENLVPYSNSPSNWATGGGGVTVTQNAFTDPLGGNTASRIQITVGTARLYQVPSLTPLQYITNAIWMKSNTGVSQSVNFGFVDWDGTVHINTYTVTTQWQQFTYTGQKLYTGDNRCQVCYVQDHGGGNTDILVYGSQCNYGEQPSSYRPTSGAAVINNIIESYAGTPIDLTNPAIGLRAWGARTNSIRNNTMVGGGAGTLPTNWNTPSTPTGVTVSVVGIGTENGIPYTEFSVVGTCTATSNLFIYFDTTTQVTASPGQYWTGSFFLRCNSGTFNPSAATVTMTAAGGGTMLNTAVAPTSAALGTQRAQGTAVAPAGTTSVYHGLFASFVNGTAYNFNIRIGAPQLEQVVASTDVASDVIFTTNAAVQCQQDLCSATPSINASQGTLQVEFTVNQTPNSGLNSGAAAELSNGTATNRVLAFLVSGTANSYVTAAGVQQTGLSLGAIAVGTVHRQAISYGIPNSDSCIDAGSIFAGTGGTAPTGMNTLTLGSQQDTTTPLFGVVRKVHLSNQAANDSTLKIITGASA